MRRILISIPTLFIIFLINFLIMHFIPGGPLDSLIERTYDRQNENIIMDSDAIDAFNAQSQQSSYDYILEQMKERYGFNKPLSTRFVETLKNYMLFDFGYSFFSGIKVTNIIKEKVPISFSLALWSTILTYLISIPLGIKKAVKRGSKFDIFTDIIINAFHAIPSFMLALILLLLFGQGGIFKIFPNKGFLSENWSCMSTLAKIKDYFMHMALPVTAIVLSNLAFMVSLCQNSVVSELNKQYVVAAFAKGLDEKKVLYDHVFRNAMLVVIVNFPIFLVHSFLHGSIIIEIMFSLNGLGLLSFESIINRDYSVLLAMLYIFSFFGLLVYILSDVLCFIVDKRVNFDNINP